MNYFDNESNIISFFQDTPYDLVFFPRKTKAAIKVFRSIHDEDKWRNWIKSSGKADPPPDFYSDEDGLMMDVMRIDDHTRTTEGGKVVNPVNQKESRIYRELREKGLIDKLSSPSIVFINATTDLPSKEDHNYTFYYTCFQRVIKKHIDSIDLYRKNHPDHKIVFFVMDESAGYIQALNEQMANTTIVPGQAYEFYLYCQFWDKKFIDAFRGTDIDYLIWYCPFKHFESNMPLDMPEVCVYDIKKLPKKFGITYPENLIISAEE